MLNVDTYTYQQLQSNNRFNIDECWNSVKYILDQIQNLQDSDYILVHNAYKQGKLNVHILPTEQESEQEEDDEYQ